MTIDTEHLRAPRERPILFSGPMVREILADRKTQTRRVCKAQPRPWERYCEEAGCAPGDWKAELFTDGTWMLCNGVQGEAPGGSLGRCPFGQPGDRLWVRETWVENESGGTPLYAADYPDPKKALGTLRRPSIHMPRWASRITLEVASVRVERVQDISGDDAAAEGVSVPKCACEVCARSTTMCTADASAHVEEFAALWDRINAARGYGWAKNPWVWVIEFRRLTP